jgi:chlorobactene glucosyltransferase
MSAALWLGPALISLFWAASLLRATRERRETPYRVGLADPPGQGRVALLIPARDEQANIGACVRAARAALGPGPAIWALDDASRDQTGPILQQLAAEDPDLHVITGDGAPLPAGWKGKPWACQRLGRAALAHDPGLDFLLFIDADVRLAPGAVPPVLGYAERNGLALLSGFGLLELRGFWENVLQPAVAGLILGANKLEHTNDPAQRRGAPIANGQLLLFSAAAYQRHGGHELVKDNVLDDVGMATALTARGEAYHVAFMTSIFSCRMYTSFSEIWEGWSKNLFAGFSYSWPKLLGVVAFIGAFVLLPWICLLAAPALPAAVGGWAALTVGLQLALRLYLDGVFAQDRRYAPTMALGWGLLALLLLSSAVQTTRGTTTWKGRPLGPAPRA